MFSRYSKWLAYTRLLPLTEYFLYIQGYFPQMIIFCMYRVTSLDWLFWYDITLTLEFTFGFFARQQRLCLRELGRHQQRRSPRGIRSRGSTSSLFIGPAETGINTQWNYTKHSTQWITQNSIHSEITQNAVHSESHITQYRVKSHRTQYTMKSHRTQYTVNHTKLNTQWNHTELNTQWNHTKLNT